jgi:tight adherence protein B
VRRLARIAITGAAIAALLTPALASGQGGALKLSEAPNTSWPDRKYLLTLPQKRQLTEAQLTVTENGEPVTGVDVTPPGGDTSGALLLIDASNSMKGAPIQGAMAAARAFLAQRKGDLPVAVVVFGPEDNVLTDFTTDKAQLSQAVAGTPPLEEGTHIYDALIRAAELAETQSFGRSTVVLLSDGTDVGSDASRSEALEALAAANMRVISIGLSSPQYDPETLQSLARRTGGTYVKTATPAGLKPVFQGIGQQLSSEYEVTYKSLLGSQQKAAVVARVAGYAPATASYTTPTYDFTARGSFDRPWIDDVIISPWLMVFVIVSVVALIGFAILTTLDVRNRSVRRRMALYVTVPTEEESRLRRAEVAAMLGEQAQRRVASQRWWQTFERDVELGGFNLSPMSIAGWTVIAGILASLVFALLVQSLWGLLVGLLAPVITRLVVKIRVSRKRAAFAEQLPDNLDVLAGSLRAGHSLVGAMAVMMDGAAEPSKTEFRRVLQDEQLGVPIDQALTVMMHRMENKEVEQVAIVTRLSREAGGNTAEVLDRVAENIRAKMEIRRLIRVLTAQGRLAMWVLMAMPLVLTGFILMLNPSHLDPLFDRTVGNFFLVVWFAAMIAGYFAIRKIVRIEL